MRRTREIAYFIFLVSVMMFIVFVAVNVLPAQCRSRVVQHYSYPVVQEQIVEQQVYYFVGQPLRIESLLRLEQANADQYGLAEEFRQFQKYRRERLASNSNDHCSTCQTSKNEATDTTSSNSNSTNAVVRGSLFSEKCGKCHSGASPKGQLSLDGDFLLTAEQFKKARDMVNSGKMPKGGPPLSNQEKDQIIAELSTKLQ